MRCRRQTWNNKGKNKAPIWRIKIGFTLLIVSLIGFPLVVSVLALLEVSGATIAAITGGLVVASELVMIAGVAIAGKQGFTYIKATVFGFFQKHGSPEKVSKTALGSAC